ncbi:possible lipoprotein [Prochlorococcus marinus str. MIT 9515]|uniref:Possible lipoprotein n=1 Tax=Prochlorococcus marinus (strain MIT 9515) TaxID=167542 RepID=A2BX29_PROM5|nr:hypothetical protein [Prochlorococcus marinus]ABM72340.1 possible lipoprotein [Prochlorococcus marinus str. MIT 9515]
MNIQFILLGLALIFLIIKIKFFRKNKNNNLFKFKKKLLSKESNIEKIFTRDDEKTCSDPDINIRIGLYENEDNINRKLNIHRARLSKFKKSKLNGEIIFIDKDQKIFKYINGKKKFI